MFVAPLKAGSCSRLMPAPSTSGRLDLGLWPQTSSCVLRPHTTSRDVCVQVFARAARVLKSNEKGRKPRRSPQPGPAVSTPHSAEDILRLNVGGTTIHTARSTMLQFPGSVLHEMFRRENEHLLLQGGDGTVFLDMDPVMFQQVLRFMREARMRGYPDATLSSFKEDDRPHLALLLHHLRLLDNSSMTQKARSYQAVPAVATSPDQSLGKKKRRQQQQQTGTFLGGSALPSGPSSSSSGTATARPPTCSPAAQADGTSKAAAVPTSTSTSPSSYAELPTPSSTYFGSSSTSQMYFIQAQCDSRRGMKISVYTEGDLVNVAPSERFEIFCNVSASRSELSFTFVCRQDFDDVFLGVTTREHIDRKGSVVPCFGWKANSRVYNTSSPQVAAAAGARGVVQQAQANQQQPLPLWGKGDSVELIVSAPSTRSSDSSSAAVFGQGDASPSMAIKVNGRELDRMSNLPSLKDWCWYVALEMGGDVSCVSLMEDSYAVFWQDYVVKRFLS